MSEIVQEPESSVLEIKEANKARLLDSGDATVAELLYFSSPLLSIPPQVLLLTMYKLVKETLVISFSTLGGQLLALSGYIFLNYIEDNEGQAAVGIVFSYNLVFFYGFSVSLSEKLGIDMSQSFGAKKYSITKKLFSQGMLTNAIFFLCLTTPLFLLSEEILLFANIEPATAARCQQIMYYMLVADLFELGGDIYRVFCMAQGIENVFGQTSILALIISVICGYLFVVKYSLGPAGWVISKIIYEFILFLVAVGAKIATQEETKGFCSWEVTFQGYRSFFWESVKYSLGSYSEFLGYEVASYFVFRTNGTAQIAAYTAIFNVTSLFYSTGETFAVICRTRMNLLIGKNLKRTAKNFYIFYLIILFSLGTAFGVLFYCLRKYITLAYAGSNYYMSEAFEDLLIVYCFCIPSELSIPTTFMGIKTVGGINLLIALNFLLFICGNFAQSYYFSMVRHTSSLPIFIGLQVLFYTENIICIARVLLTDWSKCELYTESEPSGDDLMADDIDQPGTPKRRISGFPDTPLHHQPHQDPAKTEVNNLVLY